MPIRGLLKEVKIFTPKLREIAKQQEAARVKAELEGKRKQQAQRRSKRRGT